ncbi:MAG: molecular chaperone DnaJ [Alphaproteobacteria bacterium]|nr:molecular chaperone DnaJ [Alphaproteobacteria bacterium]
MNKDPYEVLGISREATDADIKKAYHKLVLKYHPDRNPGDKEAEEKFKDINNAFDILKDPQKRAAYDRFGNSAFAGGNGADAGFGGGNPFGNGAFHFNMGGDGMEDILREAMRGFGFGDFGGGHSHKQQKGRDLLDEVVIDLRDAYFGTTHTVKFSSNVKCEKCNGHGTFDGKPAEKCKTCNGSGYIHTRQGFFAMETPCPDCNGLGKKINKKCHECDGIGTTNKQRTLDVKIPAGIMDGSRLRMPGMGEAAPNGRTPGDFYLDVHIRPNNIFERIDNDLLIHKDVDFAILALGGEIEVQTIDDKSLTVKIQSGTQVGDKLRIRGHGMPNGRGNFGDLYIEIGITIPKHLSEKQKKALSEFAAVKTDKKSWF